MSVYQISRIQIRRGKATSNNGFPQLASGEMGWSIDTQELYIGNGSVSEGSPSVGNTKIITRNDLSNNNTFLTLLEHIYKNNSDANIQTGATINAPVKRPLQSLLDERVTVSDFGAVGNGVIDDTAAIQRAINQLFSNSAGTSSEEINRRVILEIPAGTYKITSTLVIPSFATLVGVGSSASIIEYTGANTAVRLIGNPAVTDSIANSIRLRGLGISTSANNQIALELNNTINSTFDDVAIQGVDGAVFHANSKGIALNAFSSIITCELNTFNKVTVAGFTYAVYAKGDIIYNKFNNCSFTNCRQGVVFGKDANGTSVGQQFGPRNNEIQHSEFDSIMQHAVYLERGTGNLVSDITISNVGNDGGSHASATYPQMYFKTYGNAVQHIQSDRTAGLERSYVSSRIYVPEVCGKIAYELFGVRRWGITQITSPTLMFRLPVSTTSDGEPEGSIGYKLDYTYRSGNNNFTRRGTIGLAVDITSGSSQLTDEYDFAGTDSTKELKLDISVKLLDQTGVAYTGAVGQKVASVAMYYTNVLTGDYGDFSYTYKTQFLDI